MRLATILATLGVLHAAAARADPDRICDAEVDLAFDVEVTCAPEPPPPPPAPVVYATTMSMPAPEPATPDAPLDGHRWELGVAFAIVPSLGLGCDCGNGALGVHAEVGRQLGHWLLAASYAFVSFESLSTGLGGQLSRLGGTVRYRFGLPIEQTPAEVPFDVGFYLEAGVGQQTVAWTGGGEDARRDLSFGLGTETAGGRRRIGGMRAGVQVLVAPQLGAGMDATRDLTAMVLLGGMVGG